MADAQVESEGSLEEASPAGNMMEEVNPPTDDSYDSEEYERPAERWAPLGAAHTPPPMSGELSHISETDRLKNLEEEQEQLNNSLFALTTHFAQVQFRLKQIVDADAEQKEDLLKELEEFAFKGIPDINSCPMPSKDSESMYGDEEEVTEQEYDAKITEQRQKQQELIGQLKSQLEDLETYAYETGDSDLPTSKVMEKQKVIIDQLTNKLDVPDLEKFDVMSTEELRLIVDRAVGQIVHPAKVKEKLVEQLKTQIVDLERFIEFLQGEAQTPGPLGERCTCPAHGFEKTEQATTNKGKVKKPTAKDAEDAKNFRKQTLSIMRQALAVLQIFAISQFGCGGREFQKNLLKRTTKGNHWGDLRARLEMAIDKVKHLSEEHAENAPEESDYMSDSEDAPAVLCNQELATAVRKELAMALKDLLQHGLMEVGQSTSLVPFGCFSGRRKDNYEEPGAKMMHAWDLVMKYYDLKHGKDFNDSPARKLSQSFSLDMVGGKAITSKQTLLSAIEEVKSTHEPLKRSEDSMFKAFVCIGLNQKKLVPWLRLLLKTTSIVEYYYQPWSYVMKTGFDDALISLDKLSKTDFRLPVDLAIRPFHNIKDAF